MLGRSASFSEVINDAVRASDSERAGPLSSGSSNPFGDLVRERELDEMNERSDQIARQTRRLIQAIPVVTVVMAVVALWLLTLF